MFRIKKETICRQAFHTALRKACDSYWTSVAWNAIYLLDENEWNRYNEWLLLCISGVHSFGSKEVWSFIKESSLSWRAHKRNYASVILEICFKNFEEYDWRGYCNYVEVKRVYKKKR